MRGVKELANYYQDKEIYENSLTGVKYYIVAIVAVAVAIAAITIGVASATGFTFKSAFVPTVAFGVGLVAFIVGLSLLSYSISWLHHLRKTFNTLAQKSGEQSFKTAGNLLWWGAILTISSLA